MTVDGSRLITKSASCPDLGAWAIKNGLNVQYGKQKPGDIVLFDFNNNGTSDHIGLVTRVANGVNYTVEGNTSSQNQTNGGQVELRSRAKGTVNFFVRPIYTDQFTRGMVLAAALCEIGTAESPKNSNKVKYNRWFYGSDRGEPWCASFVCWCYAHMKEKPTGEYDGQITSASLGPGSKGDGVVKLQKFLNWYLKTDISSDGDFGAKTKAHVMAFQALEELVIDGEFGAKSLAAASQYAEKVITVKENGRTILATLTADTVLELPTSYIGQSLAVKSSRERAVFSSKRDGSAQMITTYSANDKKERMYTNGLGHANGATYSPNSGRYYVCSYYGSNNVKRVTSISSNTLKKINVFNAPVAISGIAFDTEKKQFIGSKGTRIYVFDGNMKKKSTFKLKLTGGTAQDIFAHNGLIYVCRSYVLGSNSYIDIYSYAGVYKGSYKCTANELESADIDEDGYIHYITWNAARLVKTKVKVK